MPLRYLAVLVTLSLCSLAATAQNEEKLDTIYNPKVVYSAIPQKYEIAGIEVTGAPNYEDYVLIGYSGLEVGQVIEIPGNAITDAVKKFWRQGLFSDVVVKLTKTYGDKAWIEIQLKQQPRISQINYHGLKKSEREDLEMRLGLVKGNQITPNIVDRATSIIKKHFEEKGFKNAEVNIKHGQKNQVGYEEDQRER